MPIDSGLNEKTNAEPLLSRIFTFLGLALFCCGVMLTFVAGRGLWNLSWSAAPSDADRLAIASVYRLHLLLGTIGLIAGGLFVAQRRIQGGLLLLTAVIAYLSFAEDR